MCSGAVHVHTCICLQLCSLSRSFLVCAPCNHAFVSSDQGTMYLLWHAFIIHGHEWVLIRSWQSMNSADGIRVSFETQFNADTQTKYLAVCGSLDVLGNWEVERAVVAGNRNYVVIYYKLQPIFNISKNSHDFFYMHVQSRERFWYVHVIA